MLRPYLLWLIPCVFCTNAFAQGTTVLFEQGELKRSSRSITALGPDLAGEKVDLFTGTVKLSHTDVSLPGNNALPVSVGRQINLSGRRLSGLFGDWDLDIPRLHGTFASGGLVAPIGWVVPSNTVSQQQLRCSRFGAPPWTEEKNGGSRAWDADQFWSGHYLFVPGEIDEMLLLRDAGNTATPTDGQTYPIVTMSHWQIRCLSTLAKGSGEGFIALSPSGTQYRFDWLVSRGYGSVTTSQGTLTRQEVWIMPTLVTDRFGNTLTYTYSTTNPRRVLSITSSDGRSLSFTYVANTLVDNISSVSDGTRTWNYTYNTSGGLVQVTQPDQSKWLFTLALPANPAYNPKPVCQNGIWDDGVLTPQPATSSVTHPSGAVVSFTLQWLLHGNVGIVDSSVNPCLSVFAVDDLEATPSYAVRSITAKSITGPGLAPVTWTYTWGPHNGSWYCIASCAASKTLSVTDPRGYATRYTFGILYQQTEGQLQRSEEGWNGTSAMRTTTTTYRAFGAGPYPAYIGNSGRAVGGSLESVYWPVAQRTVSQQGVSFTRANTGFDVKARPTVVTRSSSLGQSKTDTTVFYDHTGKWVLGQIASVTDASGLVQEIHSYDVASANRTASYAFGRLVESYSYHPDGNLYQRIDPLGRATTHTNYLRGIARNIAYADGSAESAVVNNLGLITAVTNGAGTTSTYGYDAIGRLASSTPPGGDAAAYFPTTLTFEPVASPEVGLAAGHWRQTVASGNARTVRYFDALWRERLSSTYDLANTVGTSRVVESRYDIDGRKLFASYPQRSIAAVDGSVPGSAWAHDALGRVFAQYQDSELGVLTTSTAYLAGFQRRVTTPRGHATTTSFYAWDQPSEEAIAGINAPEGVSVNISRDVFGKPLSTTRSGAGLSATRSYVYDPQQRLCKTLEPESGATVQAYDGANNLAWRASGLSLPSTSSCDQASVPAARLISHGYDARNRLTSTAYGDGSPGIGRSYTADGLPYQVWSAGSTWTYGYNNRRLQTSESLAYASATYAFTRGIDAYGNVASLAYPGGPTLAYSPDALGRPTQVSGYASAVAYHPNGAIAGYTLANGIAHSSTQNTRGLPLLWRDAGVVQDAYAYDANANVAAIVDQQEGLSSRSLGYDGLDRLTSAAGIWGAGSFGYDALDNLRTSSVGSRSLSHYVNPANNRLESLSGSQSIGFGYDVNGNITARGGQAFSFDIGNRLASAPGKASYAYDGHGRRTWVGYIDGSTKVQVYGQGGKLLYTRHSTQGDTRHIYLGERLIAEANSISATSYTHTDALGSPVARTNGSGALLSRTRYEPYGGTAAGTNPTGIGFTGHVNDADTGLVYMQQRYYEPLAARFLSVDPVTTDANSGSSFNRYVYGNNNPYRFTDPDGRQAQLLPLIIENILARVFFVGTAATVGAGTAAISNNSSDSTSGSGGSSGAAPAPAPAVGAAGSGKAAAAVGGAPPPDDDEPKRVTNPKHHQNSTSPEPKNVDKLHENAIVDGNGVRWAKSADGTIHRFSKPSNGETHWNGSTGGVNPIKPQNIPIEVRRLLGGG